MKSLFLILISLSLVSCAAISPQALYSAMEYADRGIASEEKIEWDINPNDKDQMAAFWKAHNECKEFAFKSKVMGSPYFETDIQTACIGRKGYKTRKVVASK